MAHARSVAERLGEVTLIDVRKPHEWDAGHVDGALHLPLDELPGRLGEIDRQRPLVTVCRTGARSARAASLLGQEGFRAENLEGGLKAWFDAGLPLVAGDGGPGTVADAEPPGLTPELEALKNELLGVAFGLAERFGDREPTDEEARAFMRERLMARGLSPEAADRLLRD